MSIKSLAVFCGASTGNSIEFSRQAIDFAKSLAAENITLVFGGGKVGIMGVLADTVLKHGGKVIGVMPNFLVKKEIAHTGLTKLYIVNSMHERKALLSELSDGFVLLPGGIGSLEEFFEVLSWSQLGLHQKPCGIFNSKNYYNHMIKFLNDAADSQFIRKSYLSKIIISQDPLELIKNFQHYEPISQTRWIKETHQT